MILRTAAYAVHNENYLPQIIEWLKKEKIWEYVSPKEQLLFEGKVIDRKSLTHFLCK